MQMCEEGHPKCVFAHLQVPGQPRCASQHPGQVERLCHHVLRCKP